VRRTNIKKHPDRREAPSYAVSEVAHYLDIPLATLRSWVRGRSYPVSGGKKYFKPVIKAAAYSPTRLSFINLVEAQVLDALRREHRINLPQIRDAITYLANQFSSEHPLADQQFATNGIDLFVEKYGQLINTSQDGQLAMKSILEKVLKRVQRDRKGAPARLYLFTRRNDPDAPYSVVIDPSISFGRPILEGTGIVTSIIAERYKAGENINELVQDYERPRTEIEEAIRYELRAA